MSAQLVSGWSDGKDVVYLVTRDGSDVSIRQVRAKWSAFFTGLTEDDCRTLQRMNEVIALQPQGKYVRVDFKNRWARKDILYHFNSYNRGIQASGGVGYGIWEGDVNPLRRLLSDFGNLQVSANPRIAWFDLELDSRKTFSEMCEGKARVLSWSLVGLEDAYRELDRHGSVENTALAWKRGDTRGIHAEVLEQDTDAAERALLEHFMEAAREFDVLLAWNGDSFDFRVIGARGERLRILPNGRPPLWNRHCFLDGMLVHEKYNKHAHESGEEKASLALQAVGEHFVGEGKQDFDASRTWEAWEAGGESRQRLLHYNVHDALLMPAIERKTGYVALHLAVASITRCFPDSSSLRATQQGDGYLLRLGAERDYRWPTRNRDDFEEGGDQYEGAYVMAPTRIGLINEDVSVCDYKGLYPSIMRTFNLSPDTVVYPKHPDFANAIRLPIDRTVRFRTDVRGILPSALDDLVEHRAAYTAKADAAEAGSDEQDHYNRLSQGVKIVVNSFYGIAGSPFSRVFNRDVAEGTTQTGAWLIKHVAATATGRGLGPFYGDTDSVMATGDRGVFGAMVKELNEQWPALLSQFGIKNCYIELDFEKVFRRMVMCGKKRYAADYAVRKGKPLARGKKIEVKGLEYKRGDTLRLEREMQKELIDMLLLNEEIPTIAECWEFVNRWKRAILEEPLDIEDVILTQSIKALDEYKQRYTSQKCTGVLPTASLRKKGGEKCGYNFGSTDVGEEEMDTCPQCKQPRKMAAPPAHVRVALMLAERGQEVRAGTRIEYLIVKTEEASDRLEARPARDAGIFEQIDRSYYWGKQIYPPTARVLEAVFPNEPWVETAKMKRERLKAESQAANKGKVEDLPLFAAPEPPPPAVEKGEAIAPAPAGDVVVRVDGGRELMQRLRRVLDANPGSSRVRLELVGDGGAISKVPLSLKVDSSQRTLDAIERVTGGMSVRVEAVGN